MIGTSAACFGTIIWLMSRSSKALVSISTFASLLRNSVPLTVSNYSVSVPTIDRGLNKKTVNIPRGRREYMKIHQSDKITSLLGHRREKMLFIVIPVVGFVAVLILIFIAWYIMMMKKEDKVQDKSVVESGQAFSSHSAAIVSTEESGKVNVGDLQLFTFKIIANATEQFNVNNLLGRGGFGHVYKGILPNGQEIAVKRLSVDSGQGMQEFMNCDFQTAA